jgi:TRAP-type C4-dicarboxylate transport system permease small subunit
MALIQINKNPSSRDLNWFGILFAAFFGLVGWLAWRRFGSERAALVLWGIGVVLPVIYYAIPGLRRPIYLAWMYLAFPIGLVVSYVVLALVYFAVFAPVGLIMRLVRHDPLQRAFDSARKTYWVEHRTGGPKSRYFSQY